MKRKTGFGRTLVKFIEKTDLIDEAICHHAVYFAIWKKYGCLPERFNWKLNGPDVKFYPLRPEFMESTYLLYQVKIFSLT